jgi:hypothetical protein
MRLLVKLLGGLLLSGSFGTAAQAAVFFNTGQLQLTNILFNQFPQDQTGNPVFGNIGNTTTVVRFGSDESLTTPSGGQARVQATTGLLNLLDVTLSAGGVFDAATFNLNVANPDGGNPDTGTATITAFNQVNTQFNFSFPISSAGQNFFNLTTDAAQDILHVIISTDIGLTDVRQIDLRAAPGAVPLPGALLLFLTGLAGIGLVGATGVRLLSARSQ